MSNQEQAFHDWANSQETFGYDYLEIWDAACKWQRERDANLVSEFVDEHSFYRAGTIILEQGN